MSDKWWVLLVPLAYLAGIIHGEHSGTFVLEQEAIDRGYAEHHPITGEWEWIDIGFAPYAEPAPAEGP
jgi:hypothetical protein